MKLRVSSNAQRGLGAGPRDFNALMHNLTSLLARYPALPFVVVVKGDGHLLAIMPAALPMQDFAAQDQFRGRVGEHAASRPSSTMKIVNQGSDIHDIMDDST